MSAILDISGAYSAQPAMRVGTSAAPPRHSSGTMGIEDTVELSRLGRAMADAAGEASLRLARLRAIREEIQSGSYETPERIAGTLRRLLDVLA